MSRLISLCIAVLLAAGCTKGAERADTIQTATMSADLQLSDLAGTWNVRATPEGDTATVNWTLVATSDTSGWTMKMGNAAPVPLRVAVAGDSVIIMAGPFPSAVRPGKMVTTHSITRLEGDSLLGVTHATYADGEKLTLRTTGVRSVRTP